MSPAGLPRLSILAVLTFFSGLSTAAVSTGAFITLMAGTHHALLGIPPEELRYVFAAARITAFCSLAPAFLTAVLWLMAKGANRESNGLMRGRGFYRTGFVTAILAACFSVAGHASIAGRSHREAKTMDEALIGADWKLKRVGDAGPRPDIDPIFAEASRHQSDADIYRVEGGTQVISSFQGKLELQDSICLVQRSDIDQKLQAVRGRVKMYLPGPVGVDYVTRWNALRRPNTGTCEIFILDSPSEPGDYTWGPHKIHVWRKP